MQITINFNEEEFQALKNWTSQVRPPQMEEGLFYKQVFFNGVGAVNEQLSKLAEDSLRDPATREQLRQAGVDVEKLEQEISMAKNQATTNQVVTDNVVTEIVDTTESGEKKPEQNEVPVVE